MFFILVKLQLFLLKNILPKKLKIKHKDIYSKVLTILNLQDEKKVVSPQ